MATAKATNEQFPVRLTSADLRELVHGADWEWAFQAMEDDNVTPIDTTSWTCDIYLLESENGEEYEHLTIGDGITMTAASGLFLVEIDDAVIDTYNFRSCIFKVIVTDNNSKKIPYFLGMLTFAQV